MRARFEVTIPFEGDVLKVPVKVRRLLKRENAYEAIGLEIINPPKKYLDFINALRWKQIKGIAENGEIIKLYICRECKHISFDHAPMNCPICSSTIDSFEKAPDAIKRPIDFTELSVTEKKHIPVITTSRADGYIDAHITIGEIAHEMDIDNHITFIDLYYNAPLLNKKCISRVSFNCEKMQPMATLRFDDMEEGVLTVISCCSTHGNWLAETNFQ
jgi:desulfoferrodoxin-like iron-binding protein